MEAHQGRDLTGSQAVYLAVLDGLEARGCEVTRTKMAKLLYLVDLRCVQNGRGRATTIPWRWDDYGPFHPSIYSIEDQLKAAGIIALNSLPAQVKTVQVVSLPHPAVNLADEYLMAIDETLDEFGAYAASGLRNASYRTPPMLAAVAGGDRYLPLDLEAEAPAALNTKLAHLSAVLEQHPIDDTSDPNAWRDIAHEMAGLSAARKRATTHLLD